jgi:nicotinate phosphoribosyltransferase
VCEGQVVFPYEPLIRVQGPIIQCQLIESALLTLINFPTLVATKAARICLAAQGDEVIEFGLRRAQGIDGAMTATRASFIGGCASTSNTLAAKWLGIPVRGTHAHSWVMAFDNEMSSFKAYARAMPDNSLFLVDTYNSLQGVKNAIEVGKWLREQGKQFLGIRLDSGDIAYLSIESRKLLDAAGFKDAHIIASNELDEYLIADLKQQGAKVSIWGVGTKLVTGNPQSAIDGVYKLSALRKKGNKEWRYCLKTSESMSKISDPGILQVRRYFTKDRGNIADAIYDVTRDLFAGCTIIDPLDRTRKRTLESTWEVEELLVPVMREGKCVYTIPSLIESQMFCKQALTRFDRTIKRFYNPHIYPVGMEMNLYEEKLRLIDQVREQSK